MPQVLEAMAAQKKGLIAKHYQMGLRYRRHG